MIKRCSRCSLPANFPGSNLDESGRCQHCREYDAEGAKQDQSQALQELQNTIVSVKQQSEGQGAYDCIVALSGGKDSSYMLIKLVRWACAALLSGGQWPSEHLFSTVACLRSWGRILSYWACDSTYEKLYQDNLNAQTRKSHHQTGIRYLQQLY